MPNEMTPLEAAEKLEKLLFFWKYTCKKDDGVLNYIKAMKLAISCLRAIAAGEYKQVIHAQWEQKDCSKWPVCSNCGKPTLSRGYCPVRSNYCPSCGALMGGKDDNHA